MRSLLKKLSRFLYQRIKSNSYLSGILYSAVNTSYFGDMKMHEFMLADRVRVDSYKAAIRKHVRAGQRVLDLGTGTGILSFLTMEQKPERVYAIDHGPILDLAKRVADDNGFTNIEFTSTHSRSYTPPEKVDVLLHEQMGAYCFNERMIENVVDLRDRALKPGGRILPNRFRWFFEPAMLDDDSTMPFAWERDLHGVSFRVLKEETANMGADYRMLKGSASHMYERILSEPEAAWTTDLETVQLRDLPNSITVVRTITRAGRLDGFATFFETYFDDEISFSTQPPESNMHWGVPLFRVEAVDVVPGDQVEFHLEMKDLGDTASYDFHWNLTRASAKKSLQPTHA